MRGLVGLLLRSLGADRCGPHEAELPDFLAEMIWGADGQDLSDLIKGAGHKYIRRIPKAGGGYRYFYNVTGGHGLGHHAEMVKDAAFKIRSRDGQEGHVHILEDHGDEVTLKHDESGREARVKKSALAAMLAREHAEALGVVKQRAAKTLEQARKTGTAKQQEKAAALVRKYGGDVGGRESVGLVEPVRVAAPVAEPARVTAPVAEPEPAKTREGALAEVNALPRPAAKLETGSRWGDRRWVMGDVSVSASGPYAGGGSHVDSILERKWRAARMNERGFGDSFDGLTVRGPVEGGEGGTPTPKVEAALPAPVSGAGAELGRKIQEATLSEAPYLFSRKRPKQRVELERPLVGPSGAKLLAYEWQHKTVDDVDKRGEDAARRVSDWDKAEVSPHTGREIVHHFEVSLPSGDVHTVSAESVADLLGYGSGRGGDKTSVRGLASAMIERGKVQQQIGEMEPLLARYNAAHAANDTAKLPLEDAGLSRGSTGLLYRNFKVGGSERSLIASAWDRMGDMERRSYTDGLRAQERTRRAVEAIGQDPKTFKPYDAYQSLKAAQERASKLDKRIEEGRKALEATLESAPRLFSPSLLGVKPTRGASALNLSKVGEARDGFLTIGSRFSSRDRSSPALVSSRLDGESWGNKGLKFESDRDGFRWSAKLSDQPSGLYRVESHPSLGSKAEQVHYVLIDENKRASKLAPKEAFEVLKNLEAEHIKRGMDPLNSKMGTLEEGPISVQAWLDRMQRQMA